MKRTITFLLLFIACFQSYAQNKLDRKTAAIVAEGKLLYKLEKSSWLGTDMFLEKYSERDNIGGYFSYFEGNKVNCIFFSNADNPKVIGTMSFDSTYNVLTAGQNMEQRDFTKTEAEIYEVRSLALGQIYVDTMFKTYNNANLNIIPIIHDGEKRVYVLTGPQANDVVIFGNDYLISFDEDNKITSKKKLHKNIIPIYNKDSKVKQGEALTTMHSHSAETGEFITATDICTLMLYEKHVNWKTHFVVSEKYINIWDCTNDELSILTKKEAEKMSKGKRK